MLVSLCWFRCAGSAVLVPLCWFRYAGSAVLVLLCWFRCARFAVLVTSSLCRLRYGVRIALWCADCAVAMLIALWGLRCTVLIRFCITDCTLGISLQGFRFRNCAMAISLMECALWVLLYGLRSRDCAMRIALCWLHRCADCIVLLMASLYWFHPLCAFRCAHNVLGSAGNWSRWPGS